MPKIELRTSYTPGHFVTTTPSGNILLNRNSASASYFSWSNPIIYEFKDIFQENDWYFDGKKLKLIVFHQADTV